MTPDEIERTIEFILQHQANAAVRMDETDKHLRETDRHLRELSESTSRQIRELTTSTSRFHEYVQEVIKVLAPILEIQSKRLDRLEGHR
jgi:two-component sensor histidine kinase